jgi:hypothetical protein
MDDCKHDLVMSLERFGDVGPSKRRLKWGKMYSYSPDFHLRGWVVNIWTSAEIIAPNSPLAKGQMLKPGNWCQICQGKFSCLEGGTGDRQIIFYDWRTAIELPIQSFPIGAAETLTGVPPIHLHVKKLVEQSHICTHALQASHIFHRLVDGDHKFSIKTLKGQIWGDLKSPITEPWLNLDFSSLDLDPVNRFNQPGLRPKDLYHGHIVYDIVPSPPKTDKDHKKFMTDRINLLHSSVNVALYSPQRICIATDARQHLSGLQRWFGGRMSSTCLLQLCKRALLNNGCISSLGTTLVPIHLQSVGALAPTPPK